MGPSESEIEARLAALRRRREAIDREIADLLLYLELGRRLSGADAGGAPPPDAPPPGPAPPGPPGPGAPAGATPDLRRDATPRAEPAAVAAGREPGPASLAPGPAGPDPAAGQGETSDEKVPKKIPPAVAFAQDPVGARRYGRALVEAACAVIAQARRPLHASAILPHLLARGFTVPGADPVAALNTRLWKRAGPGGPLLRLGEAVYALAGWTERPSGADPGSPEG